MTMDLVATPIGSHPFGKITLHRGRRRHRPISPPRSKLMPGSNVGRRFGSWRVTQIIDHPLVRMYGRDARGRRSDSMGKRAVPLRMAGVGLSVFLVGSLAGSAVQL